jgi:hypothetical protein
MDESVRESLCESMGESLCESLRESVMMIKETIFGTST